MPARKPASLHTRHDARADRTARELSESAIVPTTQLTTSPPESLKQHKHATATWRRLIELYAETKGEIITAFDQDVLVKYCLAEEELIELFALRAEIKKLWETHSKWLSKLKPKGDQIKDYLSALQQANALVQRFQGMDARLDGKRKLIFSLAQSLYLTPRSRAGVAPEEKEPEQPQDDMDKLLDGDG